MDKPYTYDDLPEEMKEKLRTGCFCPNCGKFAQVQVKSLGKSVGRHLIRLWRAHQRFGDDRFFTTRELYPRDNKASTEGVVARFWKLIEHAGPNHPSGAPPKAYRLTDKGRKFVMGSIYVESHAHTYNNELLELDGKLINIYTAVGGQEEYDRLMNEL